MLKYMAIGYLYQLPFFPIENVINKEKKDCTPFWNFMYTIGLVTTEKWKI